MTMTTQPSPPAQDAPPVSSTRPRRATAEPSLKRAVEYALGQHFLPGDRFAVLRNGDEIFSALLTAIEDATCTIDMLTYVYWQGDIAVQFAEALSRKADQGLSVRLLLDAVGAAPMDDDLVDRMCDAGLQGAFMGNWIEGKRDAELEIRPPRPRADDGPVSVMTLKSTASVSWSDVATPFRSQM